MSVIWEREGEVCSTGVAATNIRSRPSRRLRHAGLALAVSVLVATSVAEPLGDSEHVTLFVLTLSPARHGTAARPPVTAYETDVRRIARAFAALELPLPPRITLHLYPSAKLLAAGLVEDAGLQPILARTMGRFAAGVAFDDTLLLLEPESRRGPRAWLRLLAHEMAHLSQIQLAGGEDCGARWLAEGMADWVAFTVLDRLGVARMTVERNAVVPSASEGVATTRLGLDLDQIAEPRHFLEHGGSIGFQPLYRLAFLLVQRLIEQHGFDALVDYFRACPGTDGGATFERVFGQRLMDFERDIVQAVWFGPSGRTLPGDHRSSGVPPA